MKQKFFRIEWEGEGLTQELVESSMKRWLSSISFKDIKVCEISEKVFGDDCVVTCQEVALLREQINNYKNVKHEWGSEPKRIEKLDWKGAVMNGQANGEFIYELKKKQDELIEVVNDQKATPKKKTG